MSLKRACPFQLEGSLELVIAGFIIRPLVLITRGMYTSRTPKGDNKEMMTKNDAAAVTAIDERADLWLCGP